VPAEAAAPARPAPAPRRPSRLRRAARWAERCLAVGGAVLIVYLAGFEASEVVSPSMAPTLQGDGAGRPGNDWILTERISTRFGPPPRFELLAFQSEEGLLVAKRVVAYGGERVRIVDDGALEVDGAVRPLPPDAADVRYLRAGCLRPHDDPEAAHTVAPGTAFVLGDDSQDSWDSRFTRGIPEERWRGRVVAVVWPPSRWTWLW